MHEIIIMEFRDSIDVAANPQTCKMGGWRFKANKTVKGTKRQLAPLGLILVLLVIIQFKGRECSTNDDCSAIDKTSCVKDSNDFRLRCLCGDDSAPLNGNCPDTLKGLRHKCNSNNDCEDGMVCQFEANRTTIGVAKFMSSKTKLCLCDNDNGYVEDTEHDICSGANLQTFVNVLAPIFSLGVPFFISAAMQKHF